MSDVVDSCEVNPSSVFRKLHNLALEPRGGPRTRGIAVNLKGLLAAKAALDAEIASARKTESTEALHRVHQLVREFGFTSQQVFPLFGSVRKVKGEG